LLPLGKYWLCLIGWNTLIVSYQPPDPTPARCWMCRYNSLRCAGQGK